MLRDCKKMSYTKSRKPVWCGKAFVTDETGRNYCDEHWAAKVALDERDAAHNAMVRANKAARQTVR